MKQDDFERLKSVCEKEGFEISTYRESDDNGTLIHIKPKDIWEGVEFAECVDIACDTPELKMGRLYKIKLIYGNYVQLIGLDFSFGKQLFKPSTESAYVEQLKKEAFERFGDIKEGDRFDRTSVNPIWGNKELAKLIDGTFYLQYDKILDRLFYGNLCVYEKGKWATKLPKRIEVKWQWNTYRKQVFYNFYSDFSYMLVTKNDDEKLVEIGDFLSSQLEKYLNNEIQD
jgi:hypothetical protein